MAADSVPIRIDREAYEGVLRYRDSIKKKTGFQPSISAVATLMIMANGGRDPAQTAERGRLPRKKKSKA